MIKNGKPLCDMEKNCQEPIAYLDEKGFVYCDAHGKQRKLSHTRCRKLEPRELHFILAGQALKYYRPEESTFGLELPARPKCVR
jgi:hypothetical protein